MTDRFLVCLPETLRWEAQWSDHPKDKGGPTMRGVTIRVYAGYLGIALTEEGKPGKGTLVRDATFEMVKARLHVIPDEHLQAIYRRGYWDMVRGDDLPAGVDLAMFDWAVISGPVRAARHLQTIVGTKADGHIGPATLAAVRAHDRLALVRKVIEARRAYQRGLDDYHVFGRGWDNRCNGLEPVALAMAGQPATFDAVIAEVSAPIPLVDGNAQAATQGRAQAADPTPPKTTEIMLATTGVAGLGTALASAFAKWGAMADPAWQQVVFAFLSEPLLWASIITLAGSLTTFLWRREHAQ